MNSKRKKGFTLIELCIVLALLAMLTAAGIASFAGFRQAVQKRTAEKQLTMIQNSYQLTKSIALSNGQLPETGYEVTVHKNTANAYESYFNDRVDEMLPGEMQGKYDVIDSSFGQSNTYTIRYFVGKKVYILKDGQFSMEDQGDPPKDPIEQVKDDSDRTVKNMGDLIDVLLDLSLAERKQYLIDHGLTNVTNNLSNDTYRRYLFDIVYGGSWPEFSQEYKDKHGLTQEHLYMQPYVVDVNQAEDVVLFATTNNTSAGGWFVGMIYDKDQGIWYKGSAFSIAGMTWQQVKAGMNSRNWVALS